jgi:hypothetical protein
LDHRSSHKSQTNTETKRSKIVLESLLEKHIFVDSKEATRGTDLLDKFCQPQARFLSPKHLSYWRSHNDYISVVLLFIQFLSQRHNLYEYLYDKMKKQRVVGGMVGYFTLEKKIEVALLVQ